MSMFVCMRVYACVCGSCQTITAYTLIEWTFGVGFNHAIIKKACVFEFEGAGRRESKSVSRIVKQPSQFYKYKSIKLCTLFRHTQTFFFQYRCTLCVCVCGLVYWTFVHLIKIVYSISSCINIFFCIFYFFIKFICTHEFCFFYSWAQRHNKMAISLGIFEIKINNISGCFGYYRIKPAEPLAMVVTSDGEQTIWRLWLCVCHICDCLCVE